LNAVSASVDVLSKGQLAVVKNRQHCVSMTQQSSGFVEK
ncbi:MAG: hypothetical protein RL078_830, partial [Bacteroidota bacterium]|jgi:hypothetical protein